MKTSQKSLLTLLGSLALMVVLAVTGTRIALSNADIPRSAVGSLYSVSPNLNGFDKVDASGKWEIELVQGDQWKVEINLDEFEEGDIGAFVTEQELILKQRSKPWVWKISSTPTARIEMPNLSGLDVSGAAEVEIDGFTGSKLNIDASGAVELSALSGRYDDLLLDGSGAVRVNFKDLTVTNAYVDVSGATDINLSMDGGKLTGEISGAGSLDYYGQVSEQNIEISGAGSVKHKN